MVAPVSSSYAVECYRTSRARSHSALHVRHNSARKLRKIQFSTGVDTLLGVPRAATFSRLDVRYARRTRAKAPTLITQRDDGFPRRSSEASYSAESFCSRTRELDVWQTASHAQAQLRLSMARLKLCAGKAGASMIRTRVGVSR